MIFDNLREQHYEFKHCCVMAIPGCMFLFIFGNPIFQLVHPHAIKVVTLNVVIASPNTPAFGWLRHFLAIRSNKAL